MTRLVAGITAYRRTAFIAEALASVSVQWLKPEKVVVASDFAPPGGEWARVEGPEQGPRLAAIVDASEGADLIAFLDDDDLWEPPKIAAAIEEFGDRSVTMWNHAHREVYANGERKPMWARLRDLRGGLVSVGDHRIYGCASAMVVRRSALLAHLDTLRRVDLAADDALFWLAAAEGRVVVDPRPLATLRIHGSNSSRATGAEAQADLRHRRLVTYDVLRGAIPAPLLPAFDRRAAQVAGN